MTHETKHTPGPWVIFRPEASNGYCYINKQAHPENVGCICTIYNHDTEEGRANARLIAAAPELLEALEIAAGWGYGQPPSCHEEEIVKKAIAKARGQE